MAASAPRASSSSSSTPSSESVAGFAELVSAPRPAPAGGSTTAVAVALAAALVAKTARLSGRQIPDAPGWVPEIETLRDRALALCDADAMGVTAAMAGEHGVDPNAVVRQVDQVAARVAELATTCADQGNPALWADAMTARHLAAAAQQGIAAIVASNDGAQ